MDTTHPVRDICSNVPCRIVKVRPTTATGTSALDFFKYHGIDGAAARARDSEVGMRKVIASVVKALYLKTRPDIEYPVPCGRPWVDSTSPECTASHLDAP